MLPRRSFLSAALLLAGCGRKMRSEKPQILGTLVNQRFELTLIFLGQSAGSDSSTITVIDKLVIRDERAKEEQEFSPTDAEVFRTPEGHFRRLWSPDEALLVLPLGRFEGFRVQSASTLLKDLRRGAYLDQIRVHLDPGTRLTHEFQGWHSLTEFVFTASLPGKPFRHLKYDVTARVLHCPKSDLSDSLRGINTSGEIRPEITG